METETAMADEQPMHPYCPFSRREWESRLEGLATLLDAKINPVSEGISGIHTRLDTLNGKVANHETRFTKLETRRAAYAQIAIGLSGWAMWLADKVWR